MHLIIIEQIELTELIDRHEQLDQHERRGFLALMDLHDLLGQLDLHELTAQIEYQETSEQQLILLKEQNIDERYSTQILWLCEARTQMIDILEVLRLGDIIQKWMVVMGEVGYENI